MTPGRLMCPFCRREESSPNALCYGSVFDRMLDTIHPTGIRPVFVPADADEDQVLADARARDRARTEVPDA